MFSRDLKYVRNSAESQHSLSRISAESLKKKVDNGLYKSGSALIHATGIYAILIPSNINSVDILVFSSQPTELP